MSGPLWALVLVLAVASAAVGAGAAILLQPDNDVPAEATQVTVVAAVTPTPEAAPQAEVTQDEESTTTTRPDSTPSESTRQVPPPTDTSEGQSEPPEALQQAAAAQQEEQQSASEAQPPSRSIIAPAVVASLSPRVITQGESFAVTVESEDAKAVAATIGNRSWNLIELATGVWWGIIAVARDGDIGAAEVVVDLYGEGGAWLRSLALSFVVLTNAAPFEEITLGGTGAAPDPAEVARDIAVRFEQHTAVTGPPRWTEPWDLPIEGEVSGVFGSLRSYDGVPSDQWHHGHDIAAQHGDPIVAPAPGTVVWTGDLVLHGMGVIIDHGAGVYSGYWHMSLVAVREGVEVDPGDYLGNIGTTGLSTGPHLHWEVIVQGIDVDPVQWTAEDQSPVPPVAEEPADTLE